MSPLAPTICTARTEPWPSPMVRSMPLVLVVAALEAEIERRVEAVEQPVEAERHLVLGRRRPVEAEQARRAVRRISVSVVMRSSCGVLLCVQVAVATLVRRCAARRARGSRRVDRLDRGVEQQAHDAEHEDGGEDARRVEAVGVVDQQIAEPAIRGDELGDDGGRGRQRRRDLEAGEHASAARAASAPSRTCATGWRRSTRARSMMSGSTERNACTAETTTGKNDSRKTISTFEVRP